MKEKFRYKNGSTYIYSTLSLAIIFCLLSLGETLKNQQMGLLGYKLLNDLTMSLIIGVLFFPLYWLLLFIKESLAILITKIIFILIVFIQLALVGYSLTTHINLGADLIGYNLSDVIHTLKTSVNITITAILPFIIVPLFYLGIVFLLKKSLNKINGKYLLICLLVLANISWFLANSKRPAHQNKLHFLITDINREQKEKEMLADQSSASFKTEYPLEKPANETKDVLTPFFNLNKEKPNVVIIMVEGLGSDFIGNGEYKGFTPYLDRLISKSLYWENFLCNAGRTFGVAPSLLASLPFCEKGVMEMENFPKHNSLISILKANGYNTTYYCGDDSNFDRKRQFLEHNGIDEIIDIYKFGPKYQITQKTAAGFSWGYPDSEIFRKTLSALSNKKQQRLDIIMTLTNHEPFNFPAKNAYLKKVDQILNTKTDFNKTKYSEYKDIFACLLYADNSIKEFIEGYSKRPEFKNTIFIITGDHRLIPIPQKDNLSRFHVPLYIYSPMLKKTARFKSVSSHRDVTPSLVAFLSKNFNFNKIDKTSWLGEGLDTVRQFRNTQNIPFMRYKGGLVDYMYKEYFYSDDILYKVDENFNLSEATNGVELEQLTASFNDFKRLNAYLTGKDKITKITIGKNFEKTLFTFTPVEAAFINKNTEDLDSDQIFSLARDLAFKKERQKARTLCNYILNQHPNYADVIILKGRTLAWDGDYKNSEKELLKAIESNPYYFDGYSALMDIYSWSGQDSKVVSIGKKALGNGIANPEVGFKLAKALKKTNKKQEAKKTIDSLIAINPENIEFISFKKTI